MTNCVQCDGVFVVIFISFLLDSVVVINGVINARSRKLVLAKADYSGYYNQRKTIVSSWVRCLENNQLVITSGFPTVNFRK